MKGKLSILYSVMLSSIYCHFLQAILTVGTLRREKYVISMEKRETMAVTVTDRYNFYPRQIEHYCTYLSRCQRSGGTLQRANKHEEKLIED